MYIANLVYCLVEGSAIGLTTSLWIGERSRWRIALDLAMGLSGALLGGWFLSPLAAGTGLGNLVGAFFGAVFLTALGRLIGG